MPLRGQRLAHQIDQLAEVRDEPIVGAVCESVLASKPIGHGPDLEAPETGA